MTFSAALHPAILAATLAAVASASAAPIAPLPDVSAVPAQIVQFRGGNWGDHPLMYGDNWRAHQRQWDAMQGRGGGVGSTSCARFRSYDRRTHTYVNRNGRRVSCR